MLANTFTSEGPCITDRFVANGSDFNHEYHLHVAHRALRSARRIPLMCEPITDTEHS